MTNPRPQTPSLCTTAKLFKVFAAQTMNLEEMKQIFASLAPTGEYNIKPSDAIKAAELGKLRAVTKQPNQALSRETDKAGALMSNLLAPPETSEKMSTGKRESLKSIHDRNKPTQMGFEQQLQEIEKLRLEILNTVEKNGANPGISSAEIEQLKSKTKKYYVEVKALREKIVEFVTKTKKEADVITPIPTERVQNKPTASQP